MIVKTQCHLVPAETKAHSIVVQDDMGNPLFAAVHMAQGIIYSSIGEKDFPAVLRMVGETPPQIIEMSPRKS